MAETVAVPIHTRRLTLFGRSAFLITGIVLANIICWVIAGLTFKETGLISLCVLAWVSSRNFDLNEDR